MANYICSQICSHRTNSGYCGLTGGFENCHLRLLFQKGSGAVTKKTHYDEIRAMSDEELARFVTREDLCELTCNSSIPCDGRCEAKMLDWLREEAEP